MTPVLNAHDERLQKGLFFVPLGGAGEIGMNFNLYGCDGQWLAVDLGASFDTRNAPGVEIITPDPAFVAAASERLVGILVTHAHEDHLGAIAHLWRRLKKDVYASPFASALLRHKFKESRCPAVLREIQPGEKFSLGPFSIEYVSMTHSIPEAFSVAIESPYGVVVHSGDWKMDPEPGLGEESDIAGLRLLGDAGVLALVSDSTNVMTVGHSGSEGVVARRLEQLIHECTGRVIVTQFASNVARIAAVIDAAQQADREIVLAGRSMQRMVGVASELGYLNSRMTFHTPHDLRRLDGSAVLVLCSGNQGEPRATLTRAIAGTHPQLRINASDTVLFSSRIIPGNERAVHELYNGLTRLGARFLTWRDEPDIHVSGHPGQEEMREYFEILRPEILIPVHGETVHMARQIELARECEVPQPVLMHNGDIVRLAPDGGEIIGKVPVGRLALDGGRLLALHGPVMRERRQIAASGCVMVTLAIEKGRPMSGQVLIVGLLDDAERERLEDELTTEMLNFASSLTSQGCENHETLRNKITQRLRNLIKAKREKSPVIRMRIMSQPSV